MPLNFVTSASKNITSMRLLLVIFTVIVMAITVPIMTAQKVELSIDTSKTGAKIDRNIFGQFAEHLGHGIYEGIWVGPDSRIPNTRGIRNDVVGALKATVSTPSTHLTQSCRDRSQRRFRVAS